MITLSGFGLFALAIVVFVLISVLMGVRQVPQPSEAGLAKGNSGWVNRSRASHLLWGG